MIVMSGEALSYGEDPDYEPGTQWIRSLSVVGGPQRLVDPLVKWANQATSVHTIYQSTVRAGEMAQRAAEGPDLSLHADGNDDGELDAAGGHEAGRAALQRRGARRPTSTRSRRSSFRRRRR